MWTSPHKLWLQNIPLNDPNKSEFIPVSYLLSNISMFFLPLNPSNVLGQAKEVCEQSECNQAAPFFPSNGLCMSCVGPLFLYFPIPLSTGNLSIMSAYGASQFVSTVSVQSFLKEVIVRLAFPISGVGLMGRFSVSKGNVYVLAPPHSLVLSSLACQSLPCQFAPSC